MKNQITFSLTNSTDHDQLQQLLSDSPYKIFFSSSLDTSLIRRYLTLDDLIVSMNQALEDRGPAFVFENHNRYLAANVVRINIYRQSLASQGNRKPMLLKYDGDFPMESCTGDTRLAAAQGLGILSHVSALISANEQHLDQFRNHTIIDNFQDLQRLAGIADGTRCWFRFIDESGHYRLDWYEIELNETGVRVPDENFCLRALHQYLQAQRLDFRFDLSWFDDPKNWHIFAKPDD
jgi:hypothetical protein